MCFYARSESDCTHTYVSVALTMGRASQTLCRVTEDLPDLKTTVKLLKDII